VFGTSDHAFVVCNGVFVAGNPTHKRVNIGNESPTAIAATNDTVVLALDDTRRSAVYRTHQEKYLLLETTAGKHQKDIIHIGVSDRVFMSCSEDTEFKVWSLSAGAPNPDNAGKAVELATINTNQMVNNMAALSPDGRFVAVGAFTSDVRVWEVVYSKSNAFEKVTKIIELKGHKRGVNWLSFSSDSKRIATASKDGSWRLWRIDVRWHIGEDPVCELSVQTAHNNVDHIAINPKKDILATLAEQTLQTWDSKTGKLIEEIPNAIHAGNRVVGFEWAPNGDYLCITTTTGCVVWKF